MRALIALRIQECTTQERAVSIISPFQIDIRFEVTAKDRLPDRGFRHPLSRQHCRCQFVSFDAAGMAQLCARVRRHAKWLTLLRIAAGGREIAVAHNADPESSRELGLERETGVEPATLSLGS